MKVLRVGVSVHEHELRAVAVRGDSIVWTHVEILEESTLTAALVAVFRTMPRSRITTPHPRIVLAPRASQQRRLHGLPAAMDHRLVRAAVEENIDRFFLRSSSRLVVAEPVRHADGTLTAAALDAAVVLAITNAGKLAGVIPDAVAPSGAVVSWALNVPAGIDAFETMVSGERVRIHLDDGLAVSIQRIPRAAAPPDAAAVPTHVSALEGIDQAFAEAYAAAIANMRAVPALRRKDLRIANKAPARLLRVASSLALAASIAAWFVAPAMMATRAAARAEARMVGNIAAQRRIAESTSAARQTAAAVERIDAFRRERRSMVVLLGNLSEVLPESTAVTTLRVDSLGGTITLLAPRVMDAVSGLAAIQLLDGVQVAGPLLREVVAQKELERVTLRFRFRRTPVAPSLPLAPVVARLTSAAKTS